jgi:propanediol dehydratase small subunit
MIDKGFSGKPATEITVEAISKGEVTIDDIRIHPDTLLRQAQVAADHDNAQLAENFRRAAELTTFSDEEVMSMYDALRPGRSTSEKLLDIATTLRNRNAPLNAELFAQAAEVYARRGFAKES